jgi:hypothetical protein
VDRNRDDEQSRLILPELVDVEFLDAGEHEAGQQVDGKPHAVSAQLAISNRRQRHHETSHRTPLDAG